MGPLTLVSLVAHQGGWDEVLLVGGPLAIIAAALWLANRRVSAQLSDGERTAAPSDNDRR